MLYLKVCLYMQQASLLTDALRALMYATSSSCSTIHAIYADAEWGVQPSTLQTADTVCVSSDDDVDILGDASPKRLKGSEGCIAAPQPSEQR